MSAEHDSPDDEIAFRLLDDYLEEIRRGARPDRARLVRDHPQLAPLLDCVDALESIVPPCESPLPASAETAALPTEPVVQQNVVTPREAASTADTVTPVSGVKSHGDFGPYELLGEVGRGGMGVVYKARQKALDRIVAIKMILATHQASGDQLRRFRAEARAAAGLHHPHIVSIYEVGEVHGQPYFAMEYIEGLNLADRLSQGRLGVEAAARLVSAAADAVAHLHRQGIVHRDLKPSNILVDAQDEPHVTDFGLAKMFATDSNLTATGVIAGTPSYMAPEQAAGHTSEVGPAADVYSLGAILYEILTGRAPFREENPLDTLVQVLEQEPVRPRQLNPRIPRPLEMIVLRCLEKRPAARYASAADLADDLERFLKGEAVEAQSPHLVQRVWRWARREPALASRLGALGGFYLVEMAEFHLYHAVSVSFHAQISFMMALWALGSWIFQQFLKSDRWVIPAKFVWGALEAVLLLAILLIANGAASPLVIGYPLLIVGSGLWFRVRLVWFMTAMSLISYLVLVLDFYFWRPELQLHFDPGYNRHVVFVLGLVVLGIALAYQVERVRALSRYYERRRLP
ncbi:MAG: serine/threonine-protein kinase [Pirellulales bacterium]